jgi:hypothetical protein
MEYKQFVVRAFEREPGKWRAKILRPDGQPLIRGRKRIVQFVTGLDRTTPSAALIAALEAIDAGAFSRAGTLTEKFWRRRGQRSRAPAFDDRTFPPAQRVTQNSASTAGRSKKKPRGKLAGAKPKSTSRRAARWWSAAFGPTDWLTVYHAQKKQSAGQAWAGTASRLRVPTDRTSLDNAALLPACRNPPLTPVLYCNASIFRASPPQRAE